MDCWNSMMRVWSRSAYMQMMPLSSFQWGILLASCMQTTVDRAVAWGHANGLNFSPQNTVTVLYTCRNRFTYPAEIKVSGILVPYSQMVKYLGLDHKLLWTMHVKNKIRTCKFHLLQLKMPWGSFGVPHRI